MIDSYAHGLTVVAAIGAGVAAGVYFAFSTFVMPGLRRAAPSQAISAFNGINQAAPASPLFMLVLFGTGVACVLLLISGFQHWGEPTAAWQVVGAALYLISVVVTIAYHIPHNNQLLPVDPSAAGADAIWSRFYSGWMAWNHVRTLASVGGTVSLVLALRLSP